MKKTTIILLLSLIGYGAVAQTQYNLNYDTIRVGKVDQSSGVALYGDIYLKNTVAGLLRLNADRKFVTTTLAESDIPSLSISKVTGLQTALDGKESALTFSTGLSRTSNTVKVDTTAIQTVLNLFPKADTRYYTKIASDALYEPSFSKNTAFNKNFGTTAGTVVEGGTLGSNAYTSTAYLPLPAGSGSPLSGSLYTKPSGELIYNGGTGGTSEAYYRLGNSGSDSYIGLDNSTGGAFGGSAYSLNFYQGSNRSIHFSTNGIVGYTMDGSRNNTWTGTGTFPSIKLTTGASNGYVLKSDASGNASWQPTTSAYKGTWDASTNTPTVADGVGAIGDYYEVSTSGTQFSRSFTAGGRAIYNGTIWEPVGVSASVTSVNSQTGVVNLTTTNISEGSNLYHTTARVNAIAPTLTGTGASGTWGINISGTAPAGTLTGTTLASSVVTSSLTSAAGGTFGTNAFNSTSFLPITAEVASPLTGTLYTKSSGELIYNGGLGGTNASFYRIGNTGSDSYIGVDNSTGTAFGSAYGLFLFQGSNKSAGIATNGLLRYEVTGAGNHDFKSGTVNFGGELTGVKILSSTGIIQSDKSDNEAALFRASSGASAWDMGVRQNYAGDQLLFGKNLDSATPGVIPLLITSTTVTSAVPFAATNFSGNSSGTNTGDQTITLTGAVTGSGTGSFATTLASGIDATKLADGTVTSTELQYINTLSSNAQTQLNAKEGTITAGTTSQYYRGDKSWQTLDKTAVGLSNVDNTSDAAKPVSTATQTALDLKEDLSNKSANVALGSSNTLYPTQNAVKSYVDAAVVKFISSGYNPTITNGSNIASATVNPCHYSRVGTHVTVYGSISVTTTSGGATSSDLQISLPVASAFTSIYEATGSGSSEGDFVNMKIRADTTNDTAKLTFAATAASTEVIDFSFMYEIITP